MDRRGGNFTLAYYIFYIFVLWSPPLEKKLLHLSRPYNSLASTRVVLVVREVVVLQANRMREKLQYSFVYSLSSVEIVQKRVRL